MTSTGVNLGYHCEKKTSRVLRPPGGGHTNIFGPPEPEPVRKDHGRNASSIIEGTSPEGKPALPPTEQNAPRPQSVPEPQSVPVRQSAPEPQKTDPAPVQQAAAPQPQPSADAPARARVPPGGFSSGLW